MDAFSLLAFVVAAILRFFDSTYEAARIILSLNIIVFIVRSLQIFSVNRQLGPKLVMIRKMVIMKDSVKQIIPGEVGGIPYESDGGARRIFLKKPLKGTKILFCERDPKSHSFPFQRFRKTLSQISTLFITLKIPRKPREQVTTGFSFTHFWLRKWREFFLTNYRG